MNPQNTNSEDQQVIDLVRQVAAEEAKKVMGNNAPAESAAPESHPITLNIAGRDYTFKDSNEASAVLTQQVLAQQSQQQPQGRTVSNDEGRPAWTSEDQKKWVDLMVENPLAAFDYVDERRYGVKDPSGAMRNQLQVVQGIATQHAIDRFVSSTPDYVVCPENEQAMTRVLREMGSPQITPMTLEAAYAMADKRGYLKRNEAPAQAPPAYNPYMAAPPVASRTSNAAPSYNWESEAENLSPEQIEAVFQRHQSR